MSTVSVGIVGITAIAPYVIRVWLVGMTVDIAYAAVASRSIQTARLPDLAELTALASDGTVVDLGQASTKRVDPTLGQTRLDGFVPTATRFLDLATGRELARVSSDASTTSTSTRQATTVVAVGISATPFPDLGWHISSAMTAAPVAVCRASSRMRAVVELASTPELVMYLVLTGSAPYLARELTPPLERDGLATLRSTIAVPRTVAASRHPTRISILPECVDSALGPARDLTARWRRCFAERPWGRSCGGPKLGHFALPIPDRTKLSTTSTIAGLGGPTRVRET